MKKADIMEIIKEAANRHGFEFIQNGRDISIKDGLDWSKSWVNFTIRELEDVEWNLKEQTVSATIVVSAATSRMGGDQTVEDLLEAADTIKRAAELVREVNEIPLRYTMTFKEM